MAIDHATIPEGMQVGRLPKKLNFHIVSTLVSTRAYMKRLVDILNHVNEHFKLFGFCFWVQATFFQFSFDSFDGLVGIARFFLVTGIVLPIFTV